MLNRERDNFRDHGEGPASDRHETVWGPKSDQMLMAVIGVFDGDNSLVAGVRDPGRDLETALVIGEGTVVRGSARRWVDIYLLGLVL